MNNPYAVAAIAEQRRIQFLSEADRDRQIRQAGEAERTTACRTDITRSRRSHRPRMLWWRIATRSAHA